MGFNEPVQISVELSPEEAWEFAQFLKRVYLSAYQQFTVGRNAEDAWLMFYAGEKIRSALAEAGYTPR